MISSPLQMRTQAQGDEGIEQGDKASVWQNGARILASFRGTGTPVSWGNGSERRDAVRRKDTLAKLSHSLEPAPTANTC